MIGLLPVCSNLSDSTRLVLTLYSADSEESEECSPDLVVRPSSLVRRAPVLQHNLSHGYFSINFNPNLLLQKQQSTAAFCILVNIGSGNGGSGGDNGGGVDRVGNFLLQKICLCAQNPRV